MMIEKSIAILKEHQKTLNVDKGIEFCQEIEALDCVINTMQKIVDICIKWEHDLSYPASKAIIDISDVIVYGNMPTNALKGESEVEDEDKAD